MSAVKQLYQSLENGVFKERPLSEKPNSISSVFIDRKVPPPIEVLPEFLQKTIRIWEKAYGLAPDYFLAGVLSAVSAAAGIAYRLKVKNGFFVSGSLYMAMVGKSGQGKSPALACTLEPLKDIDFEFLRTFKEKMKAFDPEHGEETPIRRHMVLNNLTMEAVFKALSGNPKGILVYQDELAGWLKSMNAYRSGSDEEHWLSFHNNLFTKVTRITTGESTIKRPFVTLVGGMQQASLRELAKGNRKENGLLFRILFAFPERMDRLPLNRFEVEESITERYHTFIHQVHDDADTAMDLDETVFPLSEEAYKVFAVYNQSICQKINDTNFDELSSLLTKIENYCLRFALLLEVMYMTEKKETAHLSGRSISKEAMEGAVKLARYFEYCAQKVFSSLFENDPLLDLDSEVQKFYLSLPNPCTTAECVELGKKMGVYKERAAKMFLKKEDLFKRLKRGVYIKLHD